MTPEQQEAAQTAVGIAVIAALLIGWGIVALVGRWKDARAVVDAAAAESEPGWDRHVKEALALAHHTPERVTFEAPVVWHPSFGERAIHGQRIYNEEHPARTAERILREAAE